MNTANTARVRFTKRGNNNNSASVNTSSTNGVYSSLFSFPSRPLSFNSSTIGQKNFPLSKILTN